MRARAFHRWILLAAALAAAPAAMAEPARLITLGGVITEIAYALGAGAEIVAVDQSSVYPPPATVLPQLGYYRALSAEPILALAPTLVLASSHAGPPQVLEQLRDAGVALAIIPDDPAPEAMPAKIAAVGAALGRPEAAAALERETTAALARIARALDGVAARPTVVYLQSAGQRGLSAAGHGTAAAVLLDLAGAENPFSGQPGYKPLSPEALAGAAIDYVVTSERTLDGVGGVAGLLAVPGLAAAGIDAKRVIVIDELAALGLGPRLADAVASLARRLHPGLPAAPAEPQPR